MNGHKMKLVNPEVLLASLVNWLGPKGDRYVEYRLPRVRTLVMFLRSFADILPRAGKVIVRPLWKAP
jgi:hypothetical protein